MKSINPKCSNINSFIWSIIISLHHYEVIPHPERYSKIKKYFGEYEPFSDDFEGFEYCNPIISLTVYDISKQITYNSKNNTNKKAYIIKINNNRYYALKANMDKYTKLNNLLKQFTQKELSDFIFKKIIHKVY